MKKLLVLLTVLAMLFMFSVPAMANGVDHSPPGYYLKVKGGNVGAIHYFSNGHPENQSEWVYIGDNPPPQPPTCHFCKKAVAAAGADSYFGYVGYNHPSEMAAGAAFGDVDLTALSLAKGSNFAFALAKTELEGKVYVLVATNGVQENGGLSFTKATTLAILEYDANAFAMGLFLPCPEVTKTELEGLFGALVKGYSLSLGPNGSYALSTFQGTTTVALHGQDSDVGYFLSYSDLSGKVIVMQSGMGMSYVSPDGTVAWNFAVVKGGTALACGDADIVGIRSSGQVFQQGQAVGNGGVASGWSAASFTGAEGYVTRSGNFANGSGMAAVSGYNSVVQTANSVTITSQQSAIATTGGAGHVPQVD